MSESVTPAENNSAGTEYRQAAPAAPATPDYATPQYPPPAVPAQPYPAAPQPYAAPFAQPVAPAYTYAPTGAPMGYAPNGAPNGYEMPAPASAVPASAMPSSAMPSSGPAAYPTAPYPAAYPAGPYPGAAAPKKKGRALTIVLAILAVVFLLSAIGSAVEYVGKSNDLTKANQASTAAAAANAEKLSSLQKQLESTQSAAAAAAQASQGQINDLNDKLKTDSACVKASETLLNINTTSRSVFEKDINAMAKACDAADFNS